MEYLMAEKTSEKLFEFMKTITANDGLIASPLKSELDLSSYKDSKEFKEGQKGDDHLKRLSQNFGFINYFLNEP